MWGYNKIKKEVIDFGFEPIQTKRQWYILL
jgi:hypothetical protein